MGHGPHPSDNGQAMKDRTIILVITTKVSNHSCMIKVSKRLFFRVEMHGPYITIKPKKPIVKLASLLIAIIGLCGLVIPAEAGSTPGNSRSTPRPNIILIMTDDQGWGDISLHGNAMIDTPVLDQLALSGARFARFYVSPVCATTRASLLTGRYHPRTGIIGLRPGLDTIRSEEITIAEMLKSSGYVTGCFGKWHNGTHFPYTPPGQGFDEFLGFSAGHWSNYFDTNLAHNNQTIKTKGYITDVLTNSALEFIKQNQDQPFFCYIPYNAPHVPIQVPDRYFQKYKQRGLDDMHAGIYGMCENIDDNVGRILDLLDQLSIKNNTVIMFLTDNGPFSSRFNAGLRGKKKQLAEGSVRSPLFVRWPGKIRPGIRVRALAADIDILPTIAELCGISKPNTLPLDGISLVPLLNGKTDSWPKRMIFSFYAREGIRGMTPYSVRTERYRLINSGHGNQLFDMIRDPGQSKNIADIEPARTTELIMAYQAWFKDVTQNLTGRTPIPIGYTEAPTVDLPSTQGQRSKGLKFSGRAPGWNHDWITEWPSNAESISWTIDVVKPGTYEVGLLYTCKIDDVGATLQIDIDRHQLTTTLREAYDPRPIPSPDRILRQVAYEKRWATLTFGRVKLQSGPTQLWLRVVNIPNQQAMQFKSVRIKKVD